MERSVGPAKARELTPRYTRQPVAFAQASAAHVSLELEPLRVPLLVHRQQFGVQSSRWRALSLVASCFIQAIPTIPKMSPTALSRHARAPSFTQRHDRLGTSKHAAQRYLIASHPRCLLAHPFLSSTLRDTGRTFGCHQAGTTGRNGSRPSQRYSVAPLPITPHQTVLTVSYHIRATSLQSVLPLDCWSQDQCRSVVPNAAGQSPGSKPSAQPVACPPRANLADSACA